MSYPAYSQSQDQAENRAQNKAALGFALLDKKFRVVEPGSLKLFFEGPQLGLLQGKSIFQIFPNLEKHAEQLNHYAEQTGNGSKYSSSIGFESRNSRGYPLYFHFESVFSIQGILVIITDLSLVYSLEYELIRNRKQINELQDQLQKQVYDYAQTEARLLESSVDLRETQQLFSNRVARLEALHTISVALSSTLETKPLLQLIVEQSAQLLNADSCSVAILDAETEELVFQAAVDDIVGKRIPPGQGIMFRSLQGGGAQIVQDVQQDPDHYPRTGEESNLRARSMLTVPLQIQGQNLGVLAAVNRKPTNFSIEDRDLLITMANYAAIALENSRLFEEVQIQKQDLELKVVERTAELNMLVQQQKALAAIELSINQPYELQKVLEKVVYETQRLVTPTGHAVIIIWDEDLKKPGKGASTSETFPIEEILTRVRKTNGTFQWVSEQLQPIVENDILHPQYPPANPMMLEGGIKSYAAIPLIAESKVLGVLYALDSHLREYSSAELEFLTSLANRAASAIVKVNLYQAEREQRAQAEAAAAELRVRESHLAMLNDIARTAIEQQDLEAMLATIADRLVYLFQASGCYITFWDEVQNLTLPKYSNGPSSIPYQEIKISSHEKTITEAVLQAGKAFLIEDLPQSEFIRPNIDSFPQIQSVLALPLIADQQKLGAAMLGFQNKRDLSEHEIALGEQVARQVALAISKIRAIDSAREAASEAENLRKAGAIVAGTLQQDEAIERILFQLAKVIPYDSACVQLLREGYLEIVGGHGWPQDQEVVGLKFPIPGDNPNTVVIQAQKHLLLSDARQEYSPFRQAPHNHIRSWLGVPLIVHGTVIGMLALDSKQLNYFTARHADLAIAFADQVAVAIENARLFEATQQNEFEAKTARDILHRLNTVSDLIEAFPKVTEGLKALTKCTRITLALLVNDNEAFSLVALDEPRAELAKGVTMPITATSAAEDILAGRIHFTPDLSQETHFAAEKILYDGGTRARINIPLQTPDGIIGALNFTWNETQTFKQGQFHILTQIADAIALAVQKENLYKAQSAWARKLEELREAVAKISSKLEVPVFLDTVLEHAVNLIDATAGEFGTFHEAKNVLEISACYKMDRDYRGAFIHLGDGVMGHVARTQEPLILRDYKQFEGRFSKFDEGPWRGIIASPIMLGGKLLGVIVLADTRPDRNYTNSDLQLLTLYADQVAISLENARLFQEIQTLATIDELTGILNRRRLFDLGKIEFEKARRYSIPLSAIMIDIDHFKQVNDTYGHTAGDQVMRVLTRRCQQIIRSGDVFGRYGGEEFTILLPHTNIHNALELAERLRENIARTPFDTERGEIPITISLGIATLTEDIIDLASLVDRADTALILAKDSGRNRVEQYIP